MDIIGGVVVFIASDSVNVASGDRFGSAWVRLFDSFVTSYADNSILFLCFKYIFFYVEIVCPMYNSASTRGYYDTMFPVLARTTGGMYVSF